MSMLNCSDGKKKAILKGLLELWDQKRPKDICFGICMELSASEGISYSTTADMLALWPESTGNRDYPISKFLDLNYKQDTKTPLWGLECERGRAKWWQFWLPRSGLIGGCICGAVVSSIILFLAFVLMKVGG